MSIEDLFYGVQREIVNEFMDCAIVLVIDTLLDSEEVPADFFHGHRSEVIDMGIFESDEELYDRVRHEESRVAGKAEGKAEAIG